MHLRVISAILMAGCLILSVSALLLARKYYISYNLLRIDPLGENFSDNENSTISLENNGIWLIGDSRIARWDKEYFSPLNVNIFNLGVEGQSTSQVLHRLKNDLETGTPEWVILEAGINDLKVIGLDKKLAPSIKEDCFRNIASIIELCQKKNANIVVINIFPTGKIEFLRRFIWNSYVDSAIMETNERLRFYCDSNDIMYFDTYFILSKDKSRIQKIYQDGFLHINKEAYKVLSESLIKELSAKDFLDLGKED